ncbi:MAG: hypothetical protein JNL60_13365 [Bacteroidia bacterium]|nr:hypothetical protein [Bacteroidia bacterium]
MKENDKKLKDLFREKNLENAFSPDEQNWKKMAATLENERKGNKRGLIYISLLLLLGGLGTVLFLGLPHNKELVSAPQVPQSSQSLVTPEDKIQNFESASHSKPKESNRRIITPSLNTEKTQASETTQLLKSNTETKTGKSIPEKSTDKTPIVTTPQEKSENEIEQVKDSKPEKKNIHQSFAKNTSNPVIVKRPVVEEKPIQEDITAKQEEPAVVVNTKQDNNNNAQSSSAIESPSTLTDKNRTGNENAVFPDLMLMKRPVINERNSELVENISYPVNDSLMYNPIPTHRIYLEAGTSYLVGWNGGTEAKGLNPLAGLQYYHDLNKRTGLSLGLMYTTIDHLSNTSHTSTTTHLKFGEEADVTVISATKIHYLLVPLKLNYALSRNDFLGLGYTFGWLLDAESKVEEFQTRQNYVSESKVSKSMGYTKGFSPYDGQLALCYRRRIFKEFYASGEFFYGLRDIKNNGIYQGDEFDRNLGFRFSLGINLWKK